MDLDKLKKRVQKLPKASLVEELLALAGRDSVFADHLEQITAPEEEAAKLFRKRIANLKRQRRMIGYRESFDFAQKLEQLLAGLRHAITDPQLGFSLVTLFLKTDSSVFERCDDSSGSIGDVYRITATELFAHYASQLQDESHVKETLVEFVAVNDYGVHDRLLDTADQFLSKKTLQDLADYYEELARSSETKNASPHRHFKVVAALLVDPELHERAIHLLYGEDHPHGLLESAKVFLKADRPEEALARLEKNPESHFALSFERTELLRAANEKLGNSEQVTEILWQRFQKCSSYSGFQEWSQTVDEQRAAEARRQYIEKISAAKFSGTNLLFLIEAGKEDVASEYVAGHADQVSGEGYAYGFLLPVAKTLENGAFFLAASIIYRALMEDILARAISKYYNHGVRYLKKLDALAPKIESWHGVLSHDNYFEQLKQSHFRKSAFWRRYNGK